ncbi:hypothetical protein CQ015_08535 [Arthrobacter sp. MYb221]|nr:hypothetical protein CQ015_08535 [Arthrobacter sp. MYb221]
MVQIIGAPFAVLLDVVSYLVSSLLLLNIRPAAVDASSKVEAVETMKEEKVNFLSGLQFILKQPVLRSITFAAAHFNFFTSVFFGVYTFYLVRDLGLSPLFVGLASVAGGIGGVVSAVIAGRLMGSCRTSVLFCISLVVPAGAALLVPLAMNTQNEWAVFALVAMSQLVWSFAIVVNLVMSESIKQALTSSNSIARVSSAIRWLTLGVEPVGAIIGGLLATVMGGTLTLYIAAVGLATAVIWLLPRGGIRSFDLRNALAVEDEPPNSQVQNSLGF